MTWHTISSLLCSAAMMSGPISRLHYFAASNDVARDVSTSSFRKNTTHFCENTVHFARMLYRPPKHYKNTHFHGFSHLPMTYSWISAQQSLTYVNLYRGSKNIAVNNIMFTLSNVFPIFIQFFFHFDSHTQIRILTLRRSWPNISKS